MPGLNKNRFVNLSPEVEEEFTCGICSEIFDKPVVVDCCLQTFCKNCIIEWLHHNRNCPMDRRPLAIEDLMPAPRSMTNIMARLFQLHCPYFESGCPYVGALGSEDNHLKTQCQYNPDRKCQDCGGLKDLERDKSGHNCVKSLHSSVQFLRTTTERQHKQIMDLRDGMEELKRREETFIARIDSLSAKVDALQLKVTEEESVFFFTPIHSERERGNGVEGRSGGIE